MGEKTDCRVPSVVIYNYYTLVEKYVGEYSGLQLSICPCLNSEVDDLVRIHISV